MKKIPTIFVRNPENMRELLDKPHPDCKWVFNGEGVATRKYDGTCVKIENGEYFKRREIKKNKKAPVDFIEEMHDAVTGKRVGWMPVTNNPEDKYHIEGFSNMRQLLPDGTYELLGPKIQGNPERETAHCLQKHATAKIYPDAPRTFEKLKVWLSQTNIEGLVFHHPDGRMAKIKKKDFGLNR